MNFKVNDYVTIEDFKRTGEFKDFMKFGEPSKYEKFTGKLQGQNCNGYICLADNNIYKLTLD